jgi:hypothetical protein
MVTIILPTGWTHRGHKEFEGIEGPLPDVIKSFAIAHPDYKWRLLDVDGEPFGYFNVYLDDEPVPRGERLTTTVTPGATLIISPPLTGG